MSSASFFRMDGHHAILFPAVVESFETVPSFFEEPRMAADPLLGWYALTCVWGGHVVVVRKGEGIS